MRLTDFCNQRTARAPCGLPDSRLRLEPRSLAVATPVAPVRPRPEAGDEPRVELRLTANLQLQRSHGVSRDVSGGEPEHLRDRALRGPGGASIESSSALRLPAAAFSSARRARSVASDVLCRGPSERDPTSRSSPPGEAARPRLRHRLVKDSDFVETRTPSLDECSLLRSGSSVRSACAARPASPAEAFASVPRRPACADRREYGIPASPPPRPRLCHRGRASDALSPPEHEAGWLDPIALAFGPDASRRLLQPEHPTSTTTDRPIPGSCFVGVASPACAGFGDSTPGWG